MTKTTPCMSPTMKRKQDREEEKLRRAYERSRARELAKAARILKNDGPTEARATRSKAERPPIAAATAQQAVDDCSGVGDEGTD